MQPLMSAIQFTHNSQWALRW